MVRAVIVEDEHLILERIRILIEKSAQPFLIIGMRRNGADALKLIEEEKPDVAFVDIMMPQLDGLELASKIQQRGLPTRVVVITGYDKFEFAQKALRYGVSEYLLKPLQRDEFEALLERLTVDCEAERLAAEHTFQRGVDARHDLLRQLIVQAEPVFLSPNISGKIAEHNIEADFIPFYILVINRASFTIPLDVAFLREQINRHIPEKNVEVLIVSRHHISIIVGKPALDLPWRDEPSGFIQKLSDTPDLGRKVPFGMSSVHHQLSELPAAYSEALDASRQAFMGCSSEMHGAEGRNAGSLLKEIESTKDSLVVLLRTRDVTSVFALLDSVRDKLARNPIQFADFAGFVTEVRMAAAQVARENGIPLSYDVYRSHTATEVADELGSVDGVITYMRNMLSLLTSECASNNGDGKTIIAIRKYVKTNYRRAITVASISDEFGLNPSYVSSIFKKTAGLSLTQYLNKCRLNGAKKGLETGELSVQDAAFQNGFSDPYYFSKLFKREFGVSPRDYAVSAQNG